MSALRRNLLITTLFLQVLVSGSVFAFQREDSLEEADEHPWDIRIGLEASKIQNPLVGDPEQKHYLRPGVQLSYYGERFFIDDELGYILKEDDHLMVNLVVSPTLDFILFNDDLFDTNIPELRGLEERITSFNLGVEVLVDGDWGNFEFQLETDALSVHDGTQLELFYGYPFGKEDIWEIRPFIGAVWRSDNLVDYYFGVDQDETRSFRPPYEGRATWNWVAFIEGRYALPQKNWYFTSHIYYEKGGSGITDSPLLKKDHFVEYAVGVEWVKSFSINF